MGSAKTIDTTFGSVDEKVRQKTASKGKAEPTLQSLQSQISQLNQANQQQLKILNALFSMAQSPNVPSSAVFQSKYKESSSELPALVSQLEMRIKDLLEDNTKLRKENDTLKSELTKLKSNGKQSAPAT